MLLRTLRKFRPTENDRIFAKKCMKLYELKEKEVLTQEQLELRCAKASLTCMSLYKRIPEPTPPAAYHEYKNKDVGKEAKAKLYKTLMDTNDEFKNYIEIRDEIKAENHASKHRLESIMKTFADNGMQNEVRIVAYILNTHN